MLEQLKKYPVKNFNDLILLIKISLVEYKIKKIRRRAKRLGKEYPEGNDWIEWDSLLDDEAALISKTYYSRERVKDAVRQIDEEEAKRKIDEEEANKK